MPLLMGVLLLRAVLGGDSKPAQEEGRFDIYVADKEIGQEKFSIVSSSDSVSSSSTTKFRDPSGQKDSQQIETQLKMDNRYMPQTYQARTEIGGRKEIWTGKFVPSQANIECQSGGIARKIGLLVGNRYTVLDASVFHHFIFLARRFDFSGAGKTQTMETVIPREMDSGMLKIRDAGIEPVSLHGKNRELHHLKVDSGSLQIDMWIDEAHVLHKITVPAKRLEVIRH
jgi:hypothetical protein